MNDHKDGHPLRRIIGLSAALATPLDPNGGVDWERYAAHASNLLSRGMNAVTAFGTTGEGISVRAGERALLYERMAAHGIAPGRLVECVYGLAAGDTGEQMRRAFEAGCAAVLLTPPFYFKGVGAEGLYRWFGEALEAAGPGARNVILYNIPQLTGVEIGLDLLARLRQRFGDVIGGVKDSSGNWDYTERLARANTEIAILVGNEAHLAAAVRLGASGAISGIANFAPELVGKLVFGADDARIGRLIDAILARPVVPAVKAYMAATLDPAWGRVLPPLEPLDAAEAARLAEELREALAGPA